MDHHNELLVLPTMVTSLVLWNYLVAMIVLKEHVTKVQESQTSSQRLFVHYLSSDSQNDFISACAQMIRSIILEEQKAAKYFSIIVDATPDSSHTEQTTFILRYVTCQESCIIQEHFLQFC